MSVSKPQNHISVITVLFYEVKTFMSFKGKKETHIAELTGISSLVLLRLQATPLRH